MTQHVTEEFEWSYESVHTRARGALRYSVSGEKTNTEYAVVYRDRDPKTLMVRYELRRLHDRPYRLMFDPGTSFKDVKAAVEMLVLFGDRE